MSAPAPEPTSRGSGSLARGLVLVSLAGVVWGTIGPGAQVVHDRSGLTPLLVTAYRAVVAMVVLGGVVLASGRARAVLADASREWPRVVVVGVLTAVFQVSFFVAVTLAGVSVTTVVCLGLAPVLLLVVTGVRERRVPRPARIATVLVAVGGLLLVISGGGSGGGAGHPVAGILLALVSGTAYAGSADVAAPLSARLDTLTITSSTLAVAALVLVPTGLATTAVGGGAFGTGDAPSWLLVGYLGVVTLALAYGLLFAGLRSTPSSAAVVATLLEPVTAVLIAVVLLGEGLSAPQLLGCLLIAAAITGLGWIEQPTPQ